MRENLYYDRSYNENLMLKNLKFNYKFNFK